MYILNFIKIQSYHSALPAGVNFESTSLAILKELGSIYIFFHVMLDSLKMYTITTHICLFLQKDRQLKRLETFRLDHHYPGSENRSIVAVLYGELGTKEFSQFHIKLKSLANEGKIDYVVRHYVEVSTVDYWFALFLSVFNVIY